MHYDPSSHIRSLDDVETFFHHLRHERRINFHPNDLFESYVSCQGGIHTFTLEDCALYNRLMDECFNVCEKEGVEILKL